MSSRKVEAQDPVWRDSLPVHSLRFTVSAGAVPATLPVSSPLKIRSSAQGALEWLACAAAGVGRTGALAVSPLVSSAEQPALEMTASVHSAEKMPGRRRAGGAPDRHPNSRAAG